MSLVSVIVATYRRDAELRRALVSLAEQTHTHLEIVVVDDNADEGWCARVASVVEELRAAYPTVPVTLLVNWENLGPARTRNRGIDAARGEYVTFLDDDDVYLPEKIAHQLTFMVEGGYDYSLTDLYLYSEQDHLFCTRRRWYIKETDPASLLLYHLKYHMTGTDVIMMRRSYLHDIGAFAPIDIGDEFYLMLRAIDGGGRFGYLPVCDVKAYVHAGDGGLSSGGSKICGEKALYNHKKTYFPRIAPRERRYIRMRHFAVMAFAQLRRHRYLSFLWYGGAAFVSAPVQSLRVLKNRGT